MSNKILLAALLVVGIYVGIVIWASYSAINSIKKANDAYQQKIEQSFNGR